MQFENVNAWKLAINMVWIMIDDFLLQNFEFCIIHEETLLRDPEKEWKKINKLLIYFIVLIVIFHHENGPFLGCGCM